MNQSINLFGLTPSQMRILFSLEYYMADLDAEKDAKLLDVLNPFSADHKEKKVWADKFRQNVIAFMKAESSEEASTAVVDDSPSLRSIILEEENKTESSTWKYLILLECMVFSPYYPMSEEDSEKKNFKGLSMGDDSRKEALGNIAAWLGIEQGEMKRMMDAYENSVKKLTGYWNKVFIGIGAGVVAALLAVFTCGGSIAALFGASGLHGAAAISSGLAALGGGAIAAGGMGVAGGMAVLIGGGVLLGTGTGASVSMLLASTNPSAVMNECAKMFVVLKEIVLGMQHDTKRAQEILAGIIDKVASLKKEVSSLKAEQEKDKTKIKNLEKSIKYLEKFLEIA